MTEEKKATAQDVIDTLKSIDDRLRLLNQHFGITGVTVTAHASGTVPAIASDADLDGKYGNPEVKAKSPRDWTGDNMTGRWFSECPADYLDLVASRLDYFASVNDASDSADDVKKARFNRLDASRARGWAARIRAGYVAPAPEAFPSDAGVPLLDDDIPFAWLLPFALPMVLAAHAVFSA